MPRKPDPKLTALLQQRAEAQADAERWYRRMRRAMNRLDKARRAIDRADRRIDAYAMKPAPKESAA
ncbi:MAG TPA: hypothetical protein VFW33_08620 [Gemmataceae bacterium]|nr:hypothetical protein [Gemmataceae bacterium]